MAIRPAMPDEPDGEEPWFGQASGSNGKGSGSDAAAGGAGRGEPDDDLTGGVAGQPDEPVSSAQWRVYRRATILKFAGAAGFAILPFVLPDGATSRVLGLAVAVGLVVYGLRDVVAPVRVAADTQGVTVVSGYAGHRRLAWSQIERVRLDSRTRYGARSELLEIDADTSLYFFSRYDLGVPPSDALDTIIQIRRAGRPDGRA